MFEQRVPVRAGENPRADALAQPLNRKARVIEYRLLVGFAVEHQNERLFLVDLCVFGPRTRLHDRGTAGVEPELPARSDRRAAERLEPGADPELAAQAAGQIIVEVEGPGAAVEPSRGPVPSAFDLERRRCAARIAKRHHRFREARDDLSHALDRATR